MYDDRVNPEWQTMRVGGIEIRYYVREPSPGQWNAVGVIRVPESTTLCERRCPLVVGIGQTYYEAIGNMTSRALGGDHPDLPKHTLDKEIAVVASNGLH